MSQPNIVRPRKGGPNITKFVMEDVRCFAGRQEFEIRPLTFLVGENSTGKSTALGCFQVLANYIGRGRDMRAPYLDFNIDPYSMGSFKDIVRRKRPVAMNFKLGFKFKNSSVEECTITLIENAQGAEPVFEGMEIKFKDGEIHLRHDETQNIDIRERPVIDIERTIIDRSIFHLKFPRSRFITGLLDIRSVLFYLGHDFEKNTTPEEEALCKFIKRPGFQESILSFAHYDFTETFSFAPIRSRPKRTYDPTREFEDPEGSDIPMLLMRMESSKKEQWNKLQEQLKEFGRASGLFEKIEVRKHGKSMSDPFQIQVKVRGPQSSIMDVGYGVSQILPILVRMFSDRRSHQLFLLQQPEVHLHPKGQAELASLFVNAIDESRHSFIIETHSDYMINRARIEIRRGNISHKDVSLIYLEPKGASVKVCNIGFDKESNLRAAPTSYGDFFLKEANRLLWDSES